MSFVSGSGRIEGLAAGQLGGLYTEWRGRPFLQIKDFDKLPPFLMNVVGAYDLWMYLSSFGGLTAGRTDADNAIFAYQTEDKLHDSRGQVGPTTLCCVDPSSDRPLLWEPFCRLGVPNEDVDRKLLKNLIGNQVVLDELHHQYGLRFGYRWTATEEFGFVRTSVLENTGSEPRKLQLLDGVQHVLPWGLTRSTYDALSCLTRAYSRAEADTQSGLAVFSLTSGIVDDAHPCEVLRANVGWSLGLPNATTHLSAKAINEFRAGRSPAQDSMIAGVRTAFLQSIPTVTLDPGESLEWHLVLDCGLDHDQVVTLRQRLMSDDDLCAAVEDAIIKSERDLIRFVAAADGLQETADRNSTVHHFANVLFNGLRGGCFTDNYDVCRLEFSDFVQARNRFVAQRHASFMSVLSRQCRVDDLISAMREQNDPDLLRLGHEFLPVSHSRRHGDPSRPWNRFSIKLKDDDGDRILHYEGNWRDIFQNWEALCRSYPGFLESVIAKFVNGSTIDGFNPYRVTSEGLEWEEPDPEDPWANIGYWGDHQIVYLLRLLESLRAHAPERLGSMVSEDHFVYLQIPYRLRPYLDLVKNPRESIDFDKNLAAEIADRVNTLGEDGKLLSDADGTIQHVTLAEKLLVPALSKLSNFVPGAGIWMNTQRPEWNDANNALAGNGTSQVTLCYLRRYLRFFAEVLQNQPQHFINISREVEQWLTQLSRVLYDHREMLDRPEISDKQRRSFVDSVGQAFTDYRTLVYDHAFTQKTPVATETLIEFCQLAASYADQTIRLGFREDALYDAYNVIRFGNDGTLAVRPLYEMLEGQVAVISSGALSSEEVCDLIDALYLSRIYREDQESFMLYPERTLTDFIDRNVVPEDSADDIDLLRRLLGDGERSLIYRDSMGVCRFAAHLRRRSDVVKTLEQLANDERWTAFVATDGDAVANLFERVFQHHTFTGRSGTMYGYEGIGCIYWHMVSKLLLAVQEQFATSVRLNEPGAIQDRLAAQYFRIRQGLSFEKSPEQYGAFPTDPYSHTPGHRGAQQPGMTGQVKEEVLTRFGELGVSVSEGGTEFAPRLLRRSEFLDQPSVFAYVDIDGNDAQLSLPAGSLAFTYCQVPVIYSIAASDFKMRIETSEGMLEIAGNRPGGELSERIWSRSGHVKSIIVEVPEFTLN